MQVSVHTPARDSTDVLKLPHTILILDEQASVLYSGHASTDQVNVILRTLWPNHRPTYLS